MDSPDISPRVSRFAKFSDFFPMPLVLGRERVDVSGDFLRAEGPVVERHFIDTAIPLTFFTEG